MAQFEIDRAGRGFLATKESADLFEYRMDELHKLGTRRSQRERRAGRRRRGKQRQRGVTRGVG